MLLSASEESSELLILVPELGVWNELRDIKYAHEGPFVWSVRSVRSKQCEKVSELIWMRNRGRGQRLRRKWSRKTDKKLHLFPLPNSWITPGNWREWEQEMTYIFECLNETNIFSPYGYFASLKTIITFSFFTSLNLLALCLFNPPCLVKLPYLLQIPFCLLLLERNLIPWSTEGHRKWWMIKARNLVA
jgi:hypothetical protein